MAAACRRGVPYRPGRFHLGTSPSSFGVVGTSAAPLKGPPHKPPLHEAPQPLTHSKSSFTSHLVAVRRAEMGWEEREHTVSEPQGPLALRHQRPHPGLSSTPSRQRKQRKAAFSGKFLL